MRLDRTTALQPAAIPTDVPLEYRGYLLVFCNDTCCLYKRVTLKQPENLMYGLLLLLSLSSSPPSLLLSLFSGHFSPVLP
jgi:hypothetical protein